MEMLLNVQCSSSYFRCSSSDTPLQVQRKKCDNKYHHSLTSIHHSLVSSLASAAARQDQTFDFQDILQLFTFDNISKNVFGFDPNT
ncbi:hypothetical protein CR513_27434, partial [Mucuna pruriens]